MPTTHLQFSWEVQQCGSVWIHGWNHLVCEPCVFFRVMWLLGSLKYRASLSQLRASTCLDRASCRQKRARTPARSRFALENVKKLACLEHFWKMRSEERARDCSETSVSQKSHKKLRGSDCWRCVNVGQFGATRLLCGFATGEARELGGTSEQKLGEEVAERRGASAKRSLSEEVA